MWMIVLSNNELSFTRIGCNSSERKRPYSRVLYFVFKFLNTNKSHFWTNLLLGKKIQNKQSSVMSIKCCGNCGNG
jgi:hypothetical protein